jgi:hypothetical protein
MSIYDLTNGLAKNQFASSGDRINHHLIKQKMIYSHFFHANNFILFYLYSMILCQQTFVGDAEIDFHENDTSVVIIPDPQGHDVGVPFITKSGYVG